MMGARWKSPSPGRMRSASVASSRGWPARSQSWNVEEVVARQVAQVFGLAGADVIVEHVEAQAQVWAGDLGN